jgi:hypothetical protein
VRWVEADDDEFLHDRSTDVLAAAAKQELQAAEAEAAEEARLLPGRFMSVLTLILAAFAQGQIMPRIEM